MSDAKQLVLKQQGSALAVLDRRIGAIAYVKLRYPIPVLMLSGGALEGFSRVGSIGVAEWAAAGGSLLVSLYKQRSK